MDAREILIEWRAEIAAELDQHEVRLDFLHVELAVAENALLADRQCDEAFDALIASTTRNHAFHDAIEPMAAVLHKRVAEMPRADAGHVAKCRREIENAAWNVQDCRDALRQIDRALHPTPRQPIISPRLVVIKPEPEDDAPDPAIVFPPGHRAPVSGPTGDAA